MVAWVGVLIGAIGVLFDRIERREDRLQQRTDLLKPLLELYHRVSEWERFAKATNSKLSAWFHARTPEESSATASQVLFAAHAQHSRAVDSGWWLEVDVDTDETIEHRDELEFRDLIGIYAPDLEDQFRRVMSLRVGQLRRLQEFVNEPDPAELDYYLLEREKKEELKLHLALLEWTDDPDPYPVRVNEQLLRDFEHSANQLSELRREIASFIKTHWDPKDITF
jgi:hypothetical protein